MAPNRRNEPNADIAPAHVLALDTARTPAEGGCMQRRELIKLFLGTATTTSPSRERAANGAPTAHRACSRGHLSAIRKLRPDTRQLSKACRNWAGSRVVTCAFTISGPQGAELGGRARANPETLAPLHASPGGSNSSWATPYYKLVTSLISGIVARRCTFPRTGSNPRSRQRPLLRSRSFCGRAPAEE
jgi:hypothetical protein